jgi:hypothetical protein
MKGKKMPRLIDEKWRVYEPDGEPPYLVLTAEEPIARESVAYVGGESVQVFRKGRTPEEVRRIACLIAAAPELLAALRALCSHYPVPVQPGTGLAESINKARAAIAKAKGGAA